MKDLNIAIIQSSLFWEDKDANLNMFDEKINALEKNDLDLIVLPETFTTGFAMTAVKTHSEKMDGKTIQWMQSKGRESNAVICGSIMIEADGQYYNRLIWVNPNGKIDHYDKRHLFRLAYEQNYFAAGDAQKTVILKDWKIRLNICYDLRFPVWCRNQNNEYDLALFTANWPETRIMHWNTLLKARAIENMSYVIGCNRIGIDGTGKNHSGDSGVILPDGNHLIHSVKEETIYARLNKEILEKTRSRFQFYKDADRFEIK